MLGTWPSDRILRRRSLLAGMVVVVGLGCSQGATSTGEAVPQQPVNVRDLSGNGASSGAVASNQGDPANDELQTRTKWVGDIPYDVFFDDPLSVAADSRPVKAPDAADQSNADPAERGLAAIQDGRGPSTPETPAEAHSPSAAIDWQQLAEIDALNDEVKRIRNRLTAGLRTVAAYNQNLESLHNDAIILAAMAAVVAVHPGSLSWQKNARLVRDLATDMAAHAGETGRQAFMQTQALYEQLVVVLDGGPPSDGGAPEEIRFSELADRSEVMKRIKRSFEWLKSEMNTEARFRDSRDDVTREAALLAVFGGIVSTDGYGSSDEPQYQQYVREFIAGSTGMTAAVGAANYQDFITSRDRVQNSCAACHAEYAFGDEGL